MKHEAPARDAAAPAVPLDSRSGAAAGEPAVLPALELAPAPGSLPGSQPTAMPASKSPPQVLMAEPFGTDGSLRASLARMMAAEQRWPAPALASSYAELPANLSGAPHPRRKSVRRILYPSPSLPARPLAPRCVMEAAVCAPGGNVPPACDTRALCAWPAQSLASACPPLLPPEFLPPPMTLDELTALATDPDALKAFVDGQPSAAVAAGARACWKGHDACDAAYPVRDAGALTHAARSCDVTRRDWRLLAAAGRAGCVGPRVSRRGRRVAHQRLGQAPRAALRHVQVPRRLVLQAVRVGAAPRRNALAADARISLQHGPLGEPHLEQRQAGAPGQLPRARGGGQRVRQGGHYVPGLGC